MGAAPSVTITAAWRITDPAEVIGAARRSLVETAGYEEGSEALRMAIPDLAAAVRELALWDPEELATENGSQLSLTRPFIRQAVDRGGLEFIDVVDMEAHDEPLVVCDNCGTDDPEITTDKGRFCDRSCADAYELK